MTSAHWVGTPWATVMRSSAMIRTASAAFHGVGVITVVIPLAASSQVRVIDPTWAKGSGDSRRSPGSERVSVPAATAARRRWSKTAPLGRPVVPLVHTTATGSVGSSWGFFASWARRAAAARASDRRSRVPTGPPGTSAPSSTTVTVGRVRSRMDRTSAAPRRGLTPEVTAPSRAAAA